MLDVTGITQMISYKFIPKLFSEIESIIMCSIMEGFDFETICSYLYILGKFLHSILFVFTLKIFCPSNLLFSVCVCCFLESDKQSYI